MKFYLKKLLFIIYRAVLDRNKKVNLVYKNEHWVVGIRVTAQGGSDFEESPWTYNRDLKCV